jgi:hypothetical protein
MSVSSHIHELVLPLILFGVILSSPGSVKQTLVETRDGATVAVTKEPRAWANILLTQSGTPFSSKEGRFSITLPPGFPAFGHTQTTQTTSAGKIELHSYQAETSIGGCAVMYSDFPPASFQGRSAQKMLEDGSAGALKNVNGTLEKQEFTTVQGYPALKMYGSGKSGETTFYVRFHFVLARPRAYQIGYLAYDRADLDKPAIKAYLESFHVEN